MGLTGSACNVYHPWLCLHINRFLTCFKVDAMVRVAKPGGDVVGLRD
jgi:hypothetical protein